MMDALVKLHSDVPDAGQGVEPTPESEFPDTASDLSAAPVGIELPLSRIHVGERFRAVDEERVTRIMYSFEVVGQIHPIVVGPEMRSGKYRTMHRLGAGLHRLEAARRMGWARIRCEVKDASVDQLRCVELEENLARNELSALDRASFLFELKALYERLFPGKRHGANLHVSPCLAPCGHDGHTVDAPRFTAVAADKFGFAERSIRRDVRLASKLDPKVRKRLSGTPWAKDRRLLTALAKLGPEQQLAAVQHMQSGHDPVTARNLACGVPARDATPERKPRSVRPEVDALKAIRDLEGPAMTWLLAQVRDLPVMNYVPWQIQQRSEP